ncbi:MAG: TadE/TadG family type IV pilus assembly protein [Eubacteriales bacterium]|nr:TadE/TadG family type IV pilus assembly protein [Eubacteriales bacterium]
MREKNEKGSITVEAALFLPLFLFAFLSIYNLVYFTRAQVIIQYAADQAAKEVAQYSYILEKTGILESVSDLSGRASEFQKNMESIQENLDIIQAAAESALTGEDIIQNGVEVGNAAKDVYDSVDTYVKDPKSFINGAVSALKNDMVNGLSSYMVSTVARSCVRQQISMAGGSADPERYLERLGVTGVSYEKTSWCKDGTRDVRIVIDYDISSQLPFFELGPHHYRVCGSTRVWSGI